MNQGLIKVHHQELLLRIFVKNSRTRRWFWQLDSFLLYVLLRWSLQVIYGIEQTLVEQRHEFFIVTMGWVGASQIDESWMLTKN